MSRTTTSSRKRRSGGSRPSAPAKAAAADAGRAATEPAVEPAGGSTAAVATSGTKSSGGRRVFGLVAPWVTLACRVLLAVVLFVAGIDKISDPLAAARAVRAYQLLPEALAVPVGYGLPFLEIVLAVVVLAGVLTRYAGIAVGLLMLVFIAGIVSVWVRGIAIDCGCFGGGGPVEASQTQYPIEILRDTGLVVAAAWVAVFAPGRLALDRLLLGSDR